MTLSNMGITFQPTSMAGISNTSNRNINGPVGVGATIHSIASSREHEHEHEHEHIHTLEWQNKYGMKKGDVLYKINGAMVKSMRYSNIVHILNRTRTRTDHGIENGQALALIFEKNMDMDMDTSHHQKVNAIRNRNELASSSNGNVSIPVPAPAAPVPMSRPMPMDMEMEMNKQRESQTQRESNQSTSPGEGDTSMEKNLLSSIFSPQNNLNTRADDSMLSEYEYSTALRDDGDMERCPDLVAIPEGSTSGTDTCGNDQEDLEQVMSVPQQDINMNRDQFPMTSPTFSYSVSTANEEASPYPLSPLGAGITSLCIAHGDGNVDDHYRDDQDTSVISSRQQYHDSRVQMLKEKYPYLSPDSALERAHTLGGAGGAGTGIHKHGFTSTAGNVRNRKRVERNRNRNCTSSTSKSTFSMNQLANDELPCRAVDRVPSIASCSVSTVFMSPQPGFRAPASSSLVPLRCSLTESETPKTTRTSRTQNSRMSYNNIPISMLDYRFVRECDSYDTMEKIINALKSTSPPEFPSLLRLAESCLVHLRAAANNANNGGDGDQCYEAGCDENDATAMVRKTKDGVPSHIHVEVQTSVGSELHVDDYIHDRAAYETSYHKAHQVNNVEEDMDNIVMAHAELKGQMDELLHERDIMQENLTSQVESLQQLLHSVKAEMEKQAKESNDKIDSLREQKAEAEFQMNDLRESCASSSNSVLQLVENLKAKEAEIGNLAAEVFKAQESKRVGIERSESVQDRLRAQVERLAFQLRVQVKKTEATRTVVELELRSEFRGRLKKDNDRIEELKYKLNSATDDVQTLYKENQFMATEFAKFGLVSKNCGSAFRPTVVSSSIHPNTNVFFSQRFENPGQFRELLKEFAAAEACANALAKALTESETELSIILQENKEYKEKIAKLEKDNAHLSSENKELTIQMASIDEDLKNSNKLIDSLQKDLNSYQFRQKNYEKLIRKCKAATELYKSKVNGLRSQLTDGGNVVPLEDHKKIVDSSESLSKVLAEKELHIQILTDRIRNLELIIKKKICVQTGKEIEQQKKSNSDRNVMETSPSSISIKNVNCSSASLVTENVASRQSARRSRTALLQRMQNVSQSKFSKGGSKINKRSPLGTHSGNIATKYVHTSNFVSGGGKENVQ